MLTFSDQGQPKGFIRTMMGTDSQLLHTCLLSLVEICQPIPEKMFEVLMGFQHTQLGTEAIFVM